MTIQIKPQHQINNCINHIPQNWEQIYPPFGMINTLAYRCIFGRSKGMNVMCSVAPYYFNNSFQMWLHVSFSYPHKMPDLDDIYLVRNTFIPSNKECYWKFPKQSEYVNINPNCLHLWSPVDDIPITPDFTQGTGQI